MAYLNQTYIRSKHIIGVYWKDYFNTALKSIYKQSSLMHFQVVSLWLVIH